MQEIGAETQVGLRALNERVQAVKMPPALELTSCPPVVMLDAIWVPCLNTGKRRADSQHRQRPVKARRKVCVLVALGLYPQSQRWGILGPWLGKSRGLGKPFTRLGATKAISSAGTGTCGGKGLIAALIDPHVLRQRCVFHNPQSLAEHSSPRSLSHRQSRQFKGRLATDSRHL